MKVYIDAGHNHSGADTGALGCGLSEHNITYYIASKVEKMLTSKGITVKMSRNTVTDNVGLGRTVNDSLYARYNGANQWGADIFISIHCNAGGGTGCEVYCYKTGGESEKLAKTTLNGILYNTNLSSRGVKTASFAVIKNTTMPAILVETAFIDNAKDAKLLGSEDGQAVIAKGIAEGIMEYLGIDYSNNNSINSTTELTDINDIVWELGQRGLVTDKDGMIAEMKETPNGRLYWLARKVVNSKTI